MRLYLTCLLIALAVPVTASGQDEFDISADKLLGSQAGGEEIVTLEGHVRIVHGTLVAYADTGFYNRTRERVRLEGNVRVVDREIQVTGEEADYLRTEGRIIFPRGIQAQDTSAALSADRGVYDLNEETLEVNGNVTYSEAGKHMNAGHAVYSRRTGFVEADGEVVMGDDEHGATLRAGRVSYDRAKGYGLATGEPLLVLAERGTRKAMTVASDSMELYSDRKRVVAIGDVTISRGEAEGKCGRAVMVGDENATTLSENPVIVEKGSSISGETITIFTEDDEISRVIVAGTAKSIYQPEGEERTDLLGSDMELRFTGGEMSEMVITGGAGAVFTPAEADTAAGTENNRVRGETMVLAFEEGEAVTATVIGNVDGTYSLEAEGGGRDQVGYRSDTLYYDVPAEVMNLRGAASVEYRGMKLASDVIEYDSRTQNLYATVEPVLWEGSDRITGTSLAYNLKTKRGAIVAGRTRYDRGLYTGKLIRKTGEQALNVEAGTYTSCNYQDPHYTFTSSRMKMFVDDKVIAEPVVLRVRGVPIFALPFFMFPIKRGRHSGILIPRIELGLDETKGRFIRNLGYYWAPNDYFDATLWGDYYEKSRWLGHVESRYKVRYLLTGSFEGSYSEDIVSGESRWDLDGQHTQEIGENGRLILHADFVSDKKYRQDTSEDLEKALRRELQSDVSYSTRWGEKSLTVAAERRENLDLDRVTQVLPRVSLLMGRTTLIPPSDDDTGWHRGTYLSGSANGSATLDKTAGKQDTRQQATVNVNSSTDLKFGDRSQSIRTATVFSALRKDIAQWCDGCVGGKGTNSAVSTRTDFIAKFQPLGWLSLDPSVTGSFTLYDEDTSGKRFPVRLMYWGGLAATTSIYRTFFPRIGPLDALRHVVTPRLGYTYRPDFSKYKDRFYGLPSISGEVGREGKIDISLDNRLQAKLKSGGKERKLNNLMSLQTSTSYDFLYKDKGLTTPLSTISNSLRFYPSEYTSFDLDFTNNPKDLDFESLSLTTRFTYTGSGPLPPGLGTPVLEEPPVVPEEGVGGSDTAPPTTRPWHLGVIYRFNKGFNGSKDTYWLDVESGLNLTDNWRLEYSGRFDLSEHQTAYQEYSVYRDLHCWEASFVRRYSGGTWQYYFRINIKVHPEIYTESGLRTLYRSY